MIRRLMCLLHMCGGTIQSNYYGLWWECSTCHRRSDFIYYKRYRP